MTNTAQRLLRIFDALLDAFGPRRWWPADSPLEVAIGAILTQNTSWKNVEKAISSLKAEDLMDAQGIVAADVTYLAATIRSAGFFNIKARRLQTFARHLCEGYAGSMDLLRKADPTDLRKELLAINGIGPETADSILLYALEKPFFVVDAYTKRFMKNHGLTDGPLTYEDAQRYFMDRLPPDTYLYNEFHALIVRLCQLHCGKTPRCESCPLQHA
jgi:endonuclease-3 related protein